MNPSAPMPARRTTFPWTSWRLWKPTLAVAAVLIVPFLLAHFVSAHALGNVLLVAGMVCEARPAFSSLASRRPLGEAGGFTPGFFYFLLCLVGAQHCWLVDRPAEPAWAAAEVASQLGLLTVLGLAYWKLWARRRSSEPAAVVPTPEA